MPDENLQTLVYRVLRYTPNLIRDEWVNIGIVLEEAGGVRRRARLIQETAEIARVRRLQPDLDEGLLRSLPGDWETQIGAGGEAGSAFLRKLESALSNVLQLSPQRAVMAEDFDAELDRLYEAHVAPPARRGRAGTILESTRAWIRSRLNDVFRRHRVLARLEKSIRVEDYTHAGDPMRLDYAYRVNGTRGFLQAFSLNRDSAQAKVLAYTAESIRVRIPKIEFAAITEIEPERTNPRHRFVVETLAERGIAIIPLPRIETFAEDLRRRLN